jgi:hypothetical protein
MGVWKGGGYVEICTWEEEEEVVVVVVEAVEEAVACLAGCPHLFAGP